MISNKEKCRSPRVKWQFFNGFAFGIVVGVMTTTIALPVNITAHAQEPEELEPPVLDDGAIVLDPVTVTVRRRSEEQQEAPVSALVFDADELTTSSSDTIELVINETPNVVFWSQGSTSAPQITIRGVGGLGGNAGIDRQQGVGFYIDDVFIARPTGYPSYLWDTERFEIVRGSQAALYGRNAIGGAINVVSKTPGPTFGGNGELSFGTNGFRRFTGGADLPFSDSVASRLSFSLTGQEPTLDNIYDGSKIGEIKNGAARYIADFALGDYTDVRLSADYMKEEVEGWAFGLVSDVLDGNINVNERPIEKREIGGISARLIQAFDNFELTSISAFRGYDYNTTLDGDYTPAAFLSQGQWQDQRQFTQEIRLTGLLTDRLDWMLGAFYLWENLEGADQFDIFGVSTDDLSNNSIDQTTNSYSAFAEVSYAATDRLDLIGGLRYTYETKEADAAVSSPSGTSAFGIPVSASASVDFDDINPEFTARYRVTDDAIVYGRVSNGFRAGGVSQFIIDGQANVYDPETVWSYEVGAKTSWFDNRFTFGTAVFYNQWRDQQVLQYAIPSGRFIANAGESRTYGFEIESGVQVTEGLRFDLAYGYLDARYTDFSVPAFGAVYDDNRIPLSPRHSLNLGVSYEREFADGYVGYAQASYNYKGPYYFLPDNKYEQSAIHLVNARIGLTTGNFKAELWGKNLLDESYLAGYFHSGSFDTGAPAPGRSLGISVAAKF